MKQVLIIISIFLFQVQIFGQENFINKTYDCSPIIDTIDGQEVFYCVDKPPEYFNGITGFHKFISESVNLPNDNSVYYATIYVTFIIDTIGFVRNACILKSIIREDIITAENDIMTALNKMDKWTPGSYNNKKVPVRITQKIIIGL